MNGILNHIVDWTSNNVAAPGVVPTSMGVVPTSMGVVPTSMGVVPTSMQVITNAVGPAVVCAAVRCSTWIALGIEGQ
jgi:hypothetical protein